MPSSGCSLAEDDDFVTFTFLHDSKMKAVVSIFNISLCLELKLNLKTDTVSRQMSHK